MEQLTPEILLYGIFPAVGVCVLAVLIREFWPEISRFGRSIFDHYVVVRRVPAPCDDDKSPTNAPVSLGNENGETEKYSVAEPDETRNDAFHLIAIFVRAGFITETEALRLSFGVSPGKSRKYREARTKLHQALAELDQETQYRPLDDNRQPVFSEGKHDRQE